MIGRRLFHSGIGLRQTWTSECLLNRTERVLLIITALILLIAVGIWTTGNDIRSNTQVKATITVEAGDTLWSLADKYGDPNQYILKRVNELSKVNNIQKDKVLHEGEKLVIPVGNKSARIYYGGKYASREIAD